MKVFSHLKRSSGAITAAFAAFVCAVPASADAAYVDGDVFLCFRATGGQGATTDYVVDLGSASQFTTATGRVNVDLGGDILADLTTTYGANWAARADVRWSVVGVQKTSNGSFGANTMFVSRREPAAGTQSIPWVRPSTFSAGTPAGKIQAMGNRYGLGTVAGTTGQTVSASNPNALLQATGATTSYAQFQPGGVSTTGATAFSYFDDTTGIEGTLTGAAVDNAVDFYLVAPGTGDSSLIGGFKVTKNGGLLFDTNIARLADAPVGVELDGKGGAVPGAGVNPSIQGGALWSGFGNPAVNDGGDVAFLGRWNAPADKALLLKSQSGAGIFVNDTLIAKVGDHAPGLGADVVFKTLKDPVIDNLGHVAFLAMLKGTGISSTNDLVVVTNGRNGSLEILAQEGSPAVDAGGATYKNFTAVSIKGEHPPVVLTSVLPASQSGIVIFGTLTKGSGTPAVDSTNDAAAWWLPQGGENLLKLVREGDASPVSGATFKAFTLLKALGGSPAQGRGQISGNECLFQATLSTNAQAYVDATVVTNATNLSVYELTGDSIGSTTITDGKWNKLNFQSTDASGEFQSAVATLQVVKGGTVTAQQARGIFTTTDGGSSWEPLAQTQAADAPGMGVAAKFVSFRDPVNSSTDAGVAFIGVAKGGAVTTATDNGIWWQPAGGTLGLIAQEGSEPPSASGAKYKVFSSLALPGNDNGPLFTALLEKGLAGAPGPGGVTSANDSVLYAIDSSNVLKEVVREGSALLGVPGKTVKSFAVLKVVSGSAGATRYFNNNNEVVALVNFTDDTTHLTSSSIVKLVIQ